MPADTLAEALALFRADLEAACAGLATGAARVRVPRAAGLFRRKAGSPFHGTPEFFIQTGGATDFACPEERFRLGTGELAVIARGLPHAETPRDRGTPYGIVVCMHERDGFFLHRGRASPERRIQGYGTTHVPSPRGRDAFGLLDETAAEGVPAKYRARFVAGAVELFLLTLLAELPRAVAAPATSGSPLVVEAEKLVRTHLANPALSVDGLARELGCSPDHLSRQFSRERGVTLTRWLNAERVQLARDLLADPRRNVSEVAWACGFSTPGYFIRVFREISGETPGSYAARPRRAGLAPKRS